MDFIEKYRSLKESDREKVLAAAQWGNGPFTQMIFKKHFPQLTVPEIPQLIAQIVNLR